MPGHNFLIITLYAFSYLKITRQSITGVTYMDHFDFEDRYRDVYECDPFYWHPLHLPERCARMFEKLIRSKIVSRSPVRILAEANDFHLGDRSRDNSELPPYEMMLESLKKDVVSHPRAPTIGMVPNVGPVAIYKQPISRTSENLIKRIGGMYAKTGNYYDGSGASFGQIDIKGNGVKTKKDSELHNDHGMSIQNESQKENLKEIFKNPQLVKLLNTN
ncbi:uncharacterized protein LOC110385851 [Bombyx mori]|uniref:Uncharacterized protein n=1 Tax=Bombyx mori TaxID=7091 RepID=A0A8R2HRS2_BOMMO|nr:uncharacterized protein LOC110385851 [Bombyx mori]